MHVGKPGGQGPSTRANRHMDHTRTVLELFGRESRGPCHGFGVSRRCQTRNPTPHGIFDPIDARAREKRLVHVSEFFESGAHILAYATAAFDSDDPSAFDGQFDLSNGT